MASANAPPHELIIVPAVGQPGREELLNECFNIRIAVFVDEQGFSKDDEFDEHDTYATHILLRDVTTLAAMGTIRTFRTPGGYYKLTRLAILLPYRKYGFGRVLVNSLHDWVRQQSRSSGAQTAEIVAHSQIYAIPFYEKLGYRAEGSEFDEDGAPHQRVILRL